MKSLYFDVSSGASGDMILGALINLGAPAKEIERRLATLPVPRIRLRTKIVERGGMHCTLCEVAVPHEHEHRNLREITAIINKGRISAAAKDLSIRIFTRIAEAEAKVHHTAVEKIHFHEVGALDSIADIVGACVAFDLLDIGSFHVRELVDGSGTITCAHGVLPVPVPATAELVKGFPFRCINVGTELLTPTGAGIITTLAEKGYPENFTVEKIGYGAGRKVIEGHANLIRLWLGKSQAGAEHDRVAIIETNIDNTSPEILGFAMEQLFEAGALDVYFTAVHMKKNRPGVVLTVIAPLALREKICSLLFRETGTIGIRYYEADRVKAERKEAVIKSPWGNVRVKVIGSGRQARYVPEYEECRRIALKHKMPLIKVYEQIRKAG